MDGEAIESRRNPLYIAHGSRLVIGQCELRLRLFAGFESTGHAPRQAGVEEIEPDLQPDQAQQLAYQQWMQQQWLMQQYAAQQQAYQQGYQQAMMAQQMQPEAEPEEEEEILFDDAADVYTYEAAREQGLVDDSVFRRPAGEKKPELPVYEEPPLQKNETVFYAPVEDPEDGFYPPVMDEDDLTDAAMPKSAYVGHDEAERAKREVWDKYFGGGQR